MIEAFRQFFRSRESQGQRFYNTRYRSDGLGKAGVKQFTSVPQLLAQMRDRRKDFSRHEIRHWQAARIEFYQRGTTHNLQDLYTDVVLDTHLSALMNNRIAKILHQPFVFKNAAGKRDPKLSALLQEPWFRTLLQYAMESIFYGYSLIWVAQASAGRIEALRLISRSHTIPSSQQIVTDPMCKNATLTRPQEPAGALNWTQHPNELVFVSLGSSMTGLLEKAAPMTILKRHSWANWDEFEQLFGVPFRIGRVHSLQGEQALTMERILKDMGSAAYAIIPPSAEIEVKEHGKGDAHKVFEQKIRLIDAQLSKLVLGQTMTVDDGSSRSQSVVHAQTEQHITQTDIQQMLSWLNTVWVPVMRTHGYAIPADYTIDVFAAMDPQMRLEIDQTLLQAGVKLSQAYLERTYQVEIDKKSE